MRSGTHRRNLVETLLGTQGNLIALSKLAEILRTDRKIIKDRIRWLIDQGAVKATKKHRRPRPSVKMGPDTWEIIYSINRRKLTALLRKPTRKHYSKWDSMWRVIRAYRRFSRNDLCQLAGASESNARVFTKELRKAGYIREAKGTWEIVIDPGPARPIPPAK
jgi:hypothetical protein